MTSDRPEIALIAAMDRNRTIGKGGRLPWHLPEEFAYFKALTVGHPLIMGRRCYQELGHALPGRPNIILSRDPDFSVPDAKLLRDLPAGLDHAAELIAAGRAVPEIMIGGGEAIYRESLPFATRIYLTEIALEVEGGDSFFPAWPEAEWRASSRRAAVESGIRYDFVIYERIAAASAARRSPLGACPEFF